MREALWVLQIEDSESDAALIRRQLEKAGYEVYSELVQDSVQMRAALARAAWDVIICDYHVPQFNAPAALRVLQEMHQDIPFIVVSGVAGEEVAVEMMRLGAQDYLMKERLARLAPAVERELREARIRLEGAHAERELQQSEERNRAQQTALDRQQKSLEHTEALLREIHHRVKNNLQIVSSLLGLQARTVDNPETKRLLQDLGNRIHSMALLHENLYDSDDLDLVDFRRLIEDLSRHLFLAYGVNREQIDLRLDLDQIPLNLDTALPCALIVNEAVSNAIEHAFPASRKGEIRISLKEEPAGAVNLLVSDNGVGLEPGNDPEKSRSLGFRLIHMLARQVDANLQIQSRYGLEVRLKLAVASPRQSASECPSTAS